MSTPNPMGFGYGYRQQPQAPGGLSMPQPAAPGATQQQVPQIQQQQVPQTTAVPTPAMPTQFDELVQALAAKSARSSADQAGKRAGFKYDGWGSILTGGMNTAIESSYNKDADKADIERARLQDDRMQMEEMEKRKGAFDVIKMFNPDVDDTDALHAAKAIVNGVATMDQFIPKATTVSKLQQEYEVLVSLYGEDDAKKKLATKYESASAGKNDLEPWAKMPDTTKRNVGLLINADQLYQKGSSVLVGQDAKGDPDSKESAYLGPTGRNAVNRMKEAVINTLRIESGATVKEEEEAGKWRAYVPDKWDSDQNAQNKINDWNNYVNTLYTSYTEGVDVPPGLRLDKTVKSSGSAGKVYKNPEEVQADIQKGILKSGDTVQTVDGPLTVG